MFHPLARSSDKIKSIFKLTIKEKWSYKSSFAAFADCSKMKSEEFKIPVPWGFMSGKS